MTDVIIKTEEKAEEKKPEVEDIKETLKAADEYQKMKEANDKLEAEMIRTEELKAKAMLGGKAEAGQPEKSQEDKDSEEAASILERFK